jgi:excisionase family DNA binding protein
MSHAAELEARVESSDVKRCAICSIDPTTGELGTNTTTRICPKCRLDPANVDWVETPEDRAQSSSAGMIEDFLFQKLRRIVREEVRAALTEAASRNGAQQCAPSPADYLSIAEAAEIARLHHGTIREWIKGGSLKAYRAGRVYRIRREDLDARLTANRAEKSTAAKVEERVEAILAKRGLRAG